MAMKTQFLVLFLVLAFAGPAFAYNCIFSGSGAWNDSAYCKSVDGCGDCYADYAENCALDCCYRLFNSDSSPGLARGAEVIRAGDKSWNINSSYYQYQEFSECESKGECLKMGYSMACRYPYKYENNGMKTVYVPVDRQKLEACMMHCAYGCVPGEYGGIFYIERIPPSMRSCTCSYFREQFNETPKGCENYTGTGGSGQPGTGGGTGGIDVACIGKDCPNFCKVENGQATLSSQGRCSQGVCLYTTSICSQGCNAKADACYVPMNVRIDFISPYDGEQIVTTGAPIEVEIAGVVSDGGAAGLASVMVGATGITPQSANLNGERFSTKMTLPATGTFEITAEARDSAGTVLATKKITVTTGLKALKITIASPRASLYEDGKQINVEKDWEVTPDKEIIVNEDQGAWIDYSDGTQLLLNQGTSVKFRENGDIIITQGEASFNVKRNYRVATKFGWVITKGTEFKVDSSISQMRVTVLKGEVLAFSNYDTIASVSAGQYADVGMNGTITVYSSGGSVLSAVNPTPNARPVSAFSLGGGGGGCCPGAIILAILCVIPLFSKLKH